MEADEILKYGGFRVKDWVYSGDSQPVEIGELGNNLPLEEAGEERMLGVSWDPKEDTFRFKVRINLTPLKKKLRMGPDITKQELIDSPPKIITRRQYYSQVQSLFDPVGFLSPVLLTAKVLLRKTWENGCEKLP